MILEDNILYFFNQNKIILEDNIFPVLISKKFILFWKTIFSDLVTKLKPIPSFFNFQTLLFLSSIPIARVLLLNTNHKSTFQKLNKGYIYGNQLF
ncbi:hypothetical protein BEN44_20515 [Leptospira interrogans serovar Ricardi]|nr:hypothetical protein [Leptospira interrogans serovar Ricardi]